MKKFYDSELSALLLIEETGLVKNVYSKVFFCNVKDFHSAFNDITTIGSKDNKNVHLMAQLNTPNTNFYGEVQDNFNKFVFTIEKKYDESAVKCSASVFTGMETKVVFTCEIKSKKKAKRLPFAEVRLAYQKAREENHLISEDILHNSLDEI